MILCIWKVVMQKIKIFIFIVVVSIFFSSCFSKKNSAYKLIDSMISAAKQEDFNKIRQIAPYTNQLGEDEFAATVLFWKSFAEKKYKFSTVEESSEKILVRVATFDKNGDASDSFIFECSKNSDNTVFLEKNIILEARKYNIDFIDFKD